MVFPITHPGACDHAATPRPVATLLRLRLPGHLLLPSVRRGRMPSPQRLLCLLLPRTRPHPRTDAHASHLIIPSAVVPPEGEAGRGHGAKVKRPTGRTTLAPWPWSARLVPGRHPGPGDVGALLPTQVGVTRQPSPGRQDTGTLPHACGGDPSTGSVEAAPWYSSPCMWG